MKLFCAFAFLVALVSSAPLEEDRFLPHFSSATAEADSTANASASAPVDASPVIVSQGSPGKKIQITITKEFSKEHADHQGAQVEPHANAHEALNHPGHAHGDHAAAGNPHLNLNGNNLVVDNQTMADIIQKLLAGNIQNVQDHGHPLVVPPGGKPVAVIFSSAMHVVDLGDLQPAVTTPAPVAAHPVHNHTAHPAANHTEHAAINHTSLLQSILQPLASLTHLGGHAQAQASVTPVQTQQIPVQMQPMVVMMPVPQQQFQASASAQADSSAQIQQILQGILSAKQQIIAAHDASHQAHAPAATAEVAAAVETNVGSSGPQLIAADALLTTNEVPVVAVPQIRKTKTKKIDISVTKTV